MLNEAINRAEALIAEREYKEAVSVLGEIKKNLDSESKKGLYVDFLIGKAFYLDDLHHEASGMFESVFMQSERLFGRSHCFTLRALDFLARSKSKCGCHDEASRLYLRESFCRLGKSPMDAKMISESYNLYCQEKESSYAINS